MGNNKFTLAANFGFVFELFTMGVVSIDIFDAFDLFMLFFFFSLPEISENRFAC